MTMITAGLLLTLLFYGLLLLILLAVVRFLPKTLLSGPAQTALTWLPPFLGGKELRDWAAGVAEEKAREHLSGQPTGKRVCQLAREMEEAAMHAMIPLGDPSDFDRVVPCPKTGQGRVGVTAPEVLAIADYIRKHKSLAEQIRIHDLAAANARKIAGRLSGDVTPYPCALQGAHYVCCTFARRPIHCRPVHAQAIREGRDRERSGGPGQLRAATLGMGEGLPHEMAVGQGVELGLRRAIQSAGLDGDLYELNAALAIALAMPDAADRWARGEKIFRDPLQ